MNDERAFQNALDANPEDSAIRLIFADWLEERGSPRAAGYRALGRLGRYPICTTIAANYDIPDYLRSARSRWGSKPARVLVWEYLPFNVEKAYYQGFSLPKPDHYNLPMWWWAKIPESLFEMRGTCSESRRTLENATAMALNDLDENLKKVLETYQGTPAEDEFLFYV